MRRKIAVLILAGTLPIVGQARQHAGGAMPAAPVLRAPMAAPHSAARPVAVVHPVTSLHTAPHGTAVGAKPPVTHKTVHPAGWNQTSRHTSNSNDPVFSNDGGIADDFPAPGYGFDYTHYFATHPNAGRHHRFSGVSGTFASDQVYVPVFMDAAQSGSAQPQEENAPEQESAAADEPVMREPSATTRVRVQPQPPLAEQSEFIFVRRDGTLIFAVAYSWINDRLQYVTREGLRRTVLLNTLDLDATQQFNEQRGVAIRLPA